MNPTGENENARENFWARHLVPPEKSRTRLITLAVILGAWMLLLVWLFYYTVKPARENQGAPATAVTMLSEAKN